MISLFIATALAAELGRSTTATSSVNSAFRPASARDLEAFKQEMKIDPNFKPQIYFRLDAASGDMQAEIAKFTCKDGTTVTLIPQIHVAAKSYFFATDEIASQAEVSMIEGVRMAGFFGPPRDRDDRLQSTSDFENRTRDRLMTISDGFAKYRAKYHKAPTDLYDFAELYFPTGTPKDEIRSKVQRSLLDTWGRPFTFKSLPNGMVEVTSLGEDGTGTHPVTIINTPTAAPKPDTQMDEITKSYRERAKAIGLSYQGDVKLKTDGKLTTVNTDVSRDMLQDPATRDEARSANRLRNLGPIIKIADLLSKPGYHPKSFSITYGGAHMAKFEQYLTGGKMGCVKSNVQWKSVLPSPYNEAGLQPTQMGERMQMINGLMEVSATLEPDPLDLEK